MNFQTFLESDFKFFRIQCPMSMKLSVSKCQIRSMFQICISVCTHVGLTFCIYVLPFRFHKHTTNARIEFVHLTLRVTYMSHNHTRYRCVPYKCLRKIFDVEQRIFVFRTYMRADTHTGHIHTPIPVHQYIHMQHTSMCEHTKMKQNEKRERETV